MAKKISSSDLFEQEDLFKGVRDSATKTLAVFNELQAELKATAQGLKGELAANTQASTAQLKQFSAATEQSNKLMQQSIQIEKLKAQADQQKIKAEQEIVKLQKMQAQELARVAKEQEKAAQLAEKESSAYAKLSKELNDARKAYKDLAVTNKANTTEGRDLLDTITKLDTQLKSVDATVGQHQRNVGNYEGATKSLKLELRELITELQTMDASDPRFEKLTQRAGELKDQISDTQAVVQATAGTALENFASATSKVGQIGIAAFTGIKASMRLLGIENEGILEGMAKLQALTALSDTLKTFGSIGDTLDEIGAGFTAAATKLGLLTTATEANTAANVAAEAVGDPAAAAEDLAMTIAGTAATEAGTAATVSGTVAAEADQAVTATGIALAEADIATTIAGTSATVADTAATVAGTAAAAADTAATAASTAATTTDTVATGANTVATEANAVATNAANTATKGFFATLLTNPLVLVVAGVAALAYGLYKLTEASEDEKRAEEARKQVMEDNLQLAHETNSAMAKEISTFLILITQLKNSNEGSKQRSNLITEINSKYGTTLKNLADEAAFQDNVTRATQDYINKMKEKIMLQRGEKQLEQTITNELDAIDQLNYYQSKLNKLISEEPERPGWKFLQEKDELTELIKVQQERVSIAKEHSQILAKENAELQSKMDLDKKFVPSKTPPPQIKPQQDYNKELKKTVDLTREIEDEQIKAITDESQKAQTELIVEAQRRIEDIQKEVASEDQKAKLIKQIEANLITELDKLDKEYYDKKEQEEKDRLEKEKEQKEKELADQKALLDKMRAEDQKIYNAEKQLRDAQTALMDDGIKKEKAIIENSYQDELYALQNQLDDQLITREQYDKLTMIALRKKNKAIADIDTKDNAKLEEEKWKTTQEFAQQTTDFLKKQSEERIAQMDEEIAAAEKQADYYRELAANGNINAQQSLAEQERIIAESNRRKEREQKRQQRMELANTIYQTYAGHAAKDPETALMKTIKDASLLQAFISTLPMFYDGTEDTGRGGGVDGKGGFHAVLHPHERVIPKSLNDQIGNLTNEQLTRLAMEYNNGRLVGQDVAHSSLEFAVMVNELRELKEVIKHKPETNIQLGEITQSAMEIVQSTRKGNTTVYNRFKVRS